MKKIKQIWYIVHEGTKDDFQWLLNVAAWLVPYAGLGRVHWGFFRGLPEVWKAISEIIGDDQFVVCGHSRGAAQATQTTGLAIISGKIPLRRVVFGEPLSGNEEFAAIVATVPSSSYCNEENHEIDPVAEVPIYIPEIAPYARAKPLTKIPFVEGPDNPWKALGRIRLHYCPDYLRSLTAFFSQRAAA